MTDIELDSLSPMPLVRSETMETRQRSILPYRTLVPTRSISCTILARDEQGNDVWDASRFNLAISVFGDIAAFDLTGMQEGTGVVVVEIPSLNGTRAITGSPYLFTISGNCSTSDDGPIGTPAPTCDCPSSCPETPQKRQMSVNIKTSDGHMFIALTSLMILFVCLLF
eukprot:TRINITY_DN10428_c0_g1_i1.p1 TRINITY_DN10428_c0_g1~~TRINITY_DN10428_c0_g1_i1.p1  ORF type:complete len:168 (-),score=33.77 TRINITY_DN10428_c0_g1_i1:75-578(-)